MEQKRFTDLVPILSRNNLAINGKPSKKYDLIKNSMVKITHCVPIKLKV
jgi:hypothetical protein